MRPRVAAGARVGHQPEAPARASFPHSLALRVSIGCLITGREPHEAIDLLVVKFFVGRSDRSVGFEFESFRFVGKFGIELWRVRGSA